MQQKTRTSDKCRMQVNRYMDGINVTKRMRSVTADKSEMTYERQFSREVNHV